MKLRVVLCLATAALLVASAKSYSVDLLQTAMLGKTELKAGAYEIEVVKEKAVFTKGGRRIESPVTVENGDQKYRSTSLILDSSNGKPRIQEIRLGGTSTRLKFAE